MTDIPLVPAPAAGTDETPAARLPRYARPGILRFEVQPPLGLYVHLPWCLRKCPYCDFNSHEVRGNSHEARGADGPPIDRYLDALIADLEASLPLVWGRRVHSVFIGGGTPSLAAPAQIDRLLGAIRARLSLEPGCEITLEANPGTFERDRFRGYHSAGVTRLSIGVQSFDDTLLERIGRVHDGAQARAAAAEAAEVFERFNLDLIYALPGQTAEQLEDDLRIALSFAPPHLSVYHLTIEPNTLFASRPPANLPDDDTAAAMLDRIGERTASQGLERYEVSAFARADARCAHNLNYWRFGDYLGIGAGAHGKLTFPHRVLRQVRFRDPATYMDRALAGSPIAQDDEVARDQLPFEFMLNALRLRDGFALSDFTERTALPLTAIQAPLAEAERRGLIERDLQTVRPTPRGFDFLNDLLALFLTPH